MFSKLKEFYYDNPKLSLISKLHLYFSVFFVGSISGWIYEENFYFFIENILENRGFLFGPYLPVYGVGAVLMLLLLDRFRKSPLIVFFASAIVTGILEYITGLAMWQIWRRRWWDYTGLFLNINGYVCLRSVFTFALGGLLLIYIIKPIISHYLFKIPKWVRTTLCIAVGLIMIVDLIFSIRKLMVR